MVLMLTLSEGDRTIETIMHETMNTEPKELAQALNIFRETVNIFFTKKIAEDNQNCSINTTDDDSSDEDNVCLSPKKKKNNN